VGGVCVGGVCVGVCVVCGVWVCGVCVCVCVCVCGVYQQQQLEEKISTTNSFPPTRKPMVWIILIIKPTRCT